MARIMIVQGSGRKNGFTASLMQDIVQHLEQREHITCDVFHLHSYRFGPCTSCFHCVRHPGDGCILDDDWGRRGEGPLYRGFAEANALLVVDPVHGWGVSAAGRLFFERIYPTFWEGIPYGMPFGSVSCASNQGFQYQAMVEYCRLSAAHGLTHLGGVAVHVAGYEQGRREALELAETIADAALEDEQTGRIRPTDTDIFLHYARTPWNIVEEYLRNLTNNTFAYDSSYPALALAEDVFDNEEARAMLEEAAKHLREALDCYREGNYPAAARLLARTSKFWTNATFKQFLEKDVVGAAIPKTYRPLDRE